MLEDSHFARWMTEDKTTKNAIHPVLPIEEPDNSLSMGDEHLDTIPATESDEVIKSSVEDLVPIPSESEGIPDKMCDVPLCENTTPLNALNEHSEVVVNSDDDNSSSDDDSPYGEDIDYVDASPPDDEIVSLEVVEIVIPEVGGIDTNILLTIKDDILREKLLNVNLLIANIEALKDNPAPSSDVMTKSSSTSLNLFLEGRGGERRNLRGGAEGGEGKTKTFDKFYRPKLKLYALIGRVTYTFHLKKNSDSTTTHADFSKYDSFIFDLSINPFPPADRRDLYHEEFADELTHIMSLPNLECFKFKIDPDPGDLDSIDWDSLRMCSRLMISRIVKGYRARILVWGGRWRWWEEGEGGWEEGMGWGGYGGIRAGEWGGGDERGRREGGAGFGRRWREVGTGEGGGGQRTWIACVSVMSRTKEDMYLSKATNPLQAKELLQIKEMADQDTPPPTITAMKIPIIKKGEYDIWSMRMRQYICHTDHNLWDIIVNGDLEDEATPSGEQSSPPVPKTAKQLAARRNQERIKSILLLAIPDEYLLKFHNVPDAKSLWAAIKSRFGAYVSKEDINQKFLRSLPPSWSQIALIMRNKPDIDEVDIDDWNGYLRKRRKTKPKRQNRTRNGKARKRQSQRLDGSPEPRVKNVVNTGERVVKPVWDYGKRVNHQNFSKNLKYPHAKRTFNPSAVLTRAGLVNTDRSNVSTARSISTVRHVRPVYTVRPVSTARPLASKIAQSNSVIRPNHPRLDIVRPKASNSPIKRSYFTQPVYRPKDLKPDVKTFGVKNMTTVGTRAVVSKGKVENVLKKAKWGNPEILLQDHTVVDSGCSSHMTSNKAYLSDYKDFNGGFVAFGSDPKGGKITCDKKNSVLFTESECLITWSPIFKLLDEVRWLFFRAPRKMMCTSWNKKNIVPSGAESSESPRELLHMDLFGPVSIESINKKRYCLVVTDDFSRFSWVFFLVTKDEW
ncbi:integrase, catalytic region, zinc finger, CCHC-type containing protein [Tanacetum coccineum]